MMSNLIPLVSIIVVIYITSFVPQNRTLPSKSGSFATDLFGQISKGNATENVILSPISIQTALAMAYLGAEGQTASELEQVLRLPSRNKEEVGKSFAEILKQKGGDAQLNIVNKLFVKSDLQIQSTFNERARKYFHSEAENMNFSQSSAFKTINTWVEKETNNKITNLLQPGSVDIATSAIIVNAIYFKGKWQTPFSSSSTSKQSFWVSQTKSVNADIMYAKDRLFKYGELPELNATAIELPYNNSDISMIIILPNERDGLARLEEKLISVDIYQLSSSLRVQSIVVKLPKFKIEFTVKLVDVLKEMGIHSIFEDTADLSGIFQSGTKVKISDVQHKAFIDVNEAGSEAAAASFLRPIQVSFKPKQKRFIANHPFVFAIKNLKTVYFVGHVATL